MPDLPPDWRERPLVPDRPVLDSDGNPISYRQHLMLAAAAIAVARGNPAPGGVLIVAAEVAEKAIELALDQMERGPLQ